MASFLSHDDVEDKKSFRTNRSNVSHDVFNLPAVESRHGKRTSKLSNAESSDGAAEPNNHATSSTTRSRVNANKSHFSLGNPEEPVRTSVRVHHAPGGSSSGNIINWT